MRKRRVIRWFAAYLMLRIIARSLRLLVAKGVTEMGRESLPTSGPLFLHINHFTTAEEAGVVLDRFPNKGLHVLYKSDLEGGEFSKIVADSKKIFNLRLKSKPKELGKVTVGLLNYIIGSLIVRPILRLAGFIPTRREIKETVAVDKARFVIDQKGFLMAMPERTSRHDTLIEARGRGTARLCMESDCPILPVGVSGAKSAIVNGLKSYLRLGRKQHLTIAYGLPFRLSQLELNLENDPDGLLATTAIMVRVGALLPRYLWGYYEREIEEFLASNAFDVGHYQRIQSRFW